MKILLLTLFFLVALCVSAQPSLRIEDAEIIELRQKLGIDYSMPDFSTSKIDGKVIGEHLAKLRLDF